MSKKKQAEVNKTQMVTEVTFSIQEIQAILNTLGQMPTQYGNGLYSFVINKINEKSKPVSTPKEPVIPDNVKEIKSKKKGTEVHA